MPTLYDDEVDEVDDDRFPYGVNTCPACGNRTLQINPEDEYDIYCTFCEASFS